MNAKTSLMMSAVIAVALSGCATLMAGGPDTIMVQSNPPGAQVFVDDQLVGQTPMAVTLNRDTSRGLIRIQTDGFDPVVVQRSKVINGWFWANFCFGSIIGIAIDAVTGDIKRFDDTPISVGLTPGRSAPAPGGPPAP